MKNWKSGKAYVKDDFITLRDICYYKYKWKKDIWQIDNNLLLSFNLWKLENHDSILLVKMKEPKNHLH